MRYIRVRTRKNISLICGSTFTIYPPMENISENVLLFRSWQPINPYISRAFKGDEDSVYFCFKYIYFNWVISAHMLDVLKDLINNTMSCFILQFSPKNSSILGLIYGRRAREYVAGMGLGVRSLFRISNKFIQRKETKTLQALVLCRASRVLWRLFTLTLQLYSCTYKAEKHR